MPEKKWLPTNLNFLFFSALPQRRNVSVCKSENKQKCSDLFKGKKPTKRECNGCEQCTKLCIDSVPEKNSKLQKC